MRYRRLFRVQKNFTPIPMNKPRIISYTEALREATEQALVDDPSVFVVGLGVSYPNGADGSTAGLKAVFPDRILDVPVSEDAVTGMAVGAAIHGMRPIVHHGRVEFALFAADQIFTQAAKWNYMFGGRNPVPIVFRINVGRQWGNGPQHTQALYGLFGSALGLKVVIPSSPYMAKGLLSAAVRDNNPVVLLEPRWLFQTSESVPPEAYVLPLGSARVVRKGSDITVVAYGDGLLAAREALQIVTDIDVELIDLVSINPIDEETIFKSLVKTRRLLTVDTTNPSFSVGSEILARATKMPVEFRSVPTSLSCPDAPCPTSTALTESYYPTKANVANAIRAQLGLDPIEARLSFDDLHLPPRYFFSNQMP
jgi:pyruvate/2-oxoglutarate/acetoin dehydrogenase E1 component